MRRSTLLTAVVAGMAASIFLAGIQARARAHCEVPCGIYNDHARIDQMLQDATRIQHTIAQYFLTQRVKPAPVGAAGYDEYVTKLVRHHAVMVAAMKTKQTVDPGRVEDLRAAIEAIAVYYPASK